MNGILSNILLWKKFALMGVLGAIVGIVPMTLYVMEANKTIATTEQELKGVAPARALLGTIQLTQQHRGMSALVLAGNDAAQAPRQAKADEVGKAFEALQAIARTGLADAELGEAIDAARRDWAAIASKVAQRELSAKDSFSLHTALVKQLLKANELMLDHTGMSQDPQRDSFYMIDVAMVQAPLLTEILGRTRARGGALLTKGAAAPEERSGIEALVDRGRERFEWLHASLAKTSTGAGAKSALAAAASTARDSADGALKLASDAIVTADSISLPPATFVAQLTAAIDDQFKLSSAAVDALDLALHARLTALTTKLYLLCGGIAILFAAIASFAVLIVRSITVPLNTALSVAQRVANGDLCSDIAVAGSDETSQLLQALREMNGGLATIVTQVRSGTETIATASVQIASGNFDLSARTEQQASSLEETASSMEELASTVKQNADSARQANAMAATAAGVAGKGGAVVAQVVQTMGSISDSSRRIVDIISVIDGIAFQTNILALNAAVEAARAGEQGRGFAVVAAEVRNLAQRSASAAKEIKALIEDSVDKVGAGTRLVDEAGSTMNEIVASVERVSAIMGSIADASNEQEAGIEQINQAIAEMDNVTQQNAALVEEAAAASASLQEQASQLAQAVSVFRLAASGAARTPAMGAARRTTVAAPDERAVEKIASATITRAKRLAKQTETASADWEEF